MRISTYPDSELFAQLGTNPVIDAAYAAYHPKHLAYKAKYDEWIAQGGMQKGQSLNLKQLLLLLSQTQVDLWETKIKLVYNKTTPRFTELFPKGHSPFQKGKQTTRIAAVQALVIAIGSDVVLATVKTEVETFYTMLDIANNTQKGSKGKTKGKSNDLENARLAMCVAQFANLGSLINLHAEKPTDLEKYFDLEAIRNHKQLIYTSHLAPDAEETLIEHTFEAGSTITVSVLNNANIRILLSSHKDVYEGNMVEVLANSTKIINVNDFSVDLKTHRYLVIVNLSSSETVSYKVALI